MEQIIFNYVLQAGGFVVLAVFALAVWRMVNKNNSANAAESAVYDLMSKEIQRLNGALEEAHSEIVELRKAYKEEIEKSRQEIVRLWDRISELEIQHKKGK